MPSLAEDRDEILQLLYRYCHGFDGDNPVAFADTFTDDGVLDTPFMVKAGRDELLELAASVQGARHITANPVIEVDGNRATARAYAMVYLDGELSTFGEYSDEIVRTPNGWRFAKRVFTLFGPAPDISAMPAPASTERA